MSSLSLEASIRTCKVDSGWANKMESDRFLNPNLMVCPVWNGMDSTGRPVCADSFVTKRAGCNSAADRVVVENGLRPQYAEYITLDSSGIRGNMYQTQSWNRTNSLDNISKVAGNFGLDYGSNIYPKCTKDYTTAMSQVSENKRRQQAMQNGFNGNQMRGCSGF